MADQSDFGVGPFNNHYQLYRKLTIKDGISALADVSLNGITDGQILQYNLTTGVFENVDVSTLSPGVSATNGVLYSASTWTDNADGTLTLPDVDVVLYDDQNWTGVAGVYTVTGGTTGTDFTALTDESTNYIYLDYNSGTPQWVITASEPDYDRSDRAKYVTLYRAGNFLHILDWEFEASGLSNKLLQRVYEINKIQRATGLAISAGGNDPLQVNIAAGDIWNGINREVTPDINSWDDTFFSNYHTAGVWDRTVSGAGSGIANNTHYDDGTDKVALTAGYYVVNWYYKGSESGSHVYEVLGRDEYKKVADAQLETAPPIPELVESHAILVGRIICQEGNASPVTIESAFDNTFAASSVTAHNDLSGIQGGTGGEYYHLTNTEHTYLTTNTFALVGTYTDSYVPRWNATLNTLESGIIQDNGSSGSIGASIQPNAKFVIYSDTASANEYALGVVNNATLTTTSPNIGIYGFANGSVSGSTWYNAGGVFDGAGNDSINYGVIGQAIDITVGENIGGRFEARGGATNYALQIVDGSQGVGKVLTSDANGRAKWQTPSGGLTPTYQSGATYTAANGDLVVAANAALVITLPTAAADIIIGVKSVVVPTAMEVRSAAAGETVDGQDRSVTGEAINNQWDYIEFVSYTPDGGSTYDWLIR